MLKAVTLALLLFLPQAHASKPKVKASSAWEADWAATDARHTLVIDYGTLTNVGLLLAKEQKGKATRYLLSSFVGPTTISTANLTEPAFYDLYARFQNFLVRESAEADWMPPCSEHVGIQVQRAGKARFTTQLCDFSSPEARTEFLELLKSTKAIL